MSIENMFKTIVTPNHSLLQMLSSNTNQNKRLPEKQVSSKPYIPMPKM